LALKQIFQGRSSESGHLERDEGFEIRFVTFNEIKLSLWKVFGSAADSIVYDAGIEPGRRSCRRLVTIAGGAKETLVLLSERKANQNWGQFSFNKVDLQRGTGRICVDNSFESREMRVEGTSCNFLRGYFAGFLSELFHLGIAVTEEKCRARGDTRCEFTFRAA
jgi:predicted hydrocarbon binding protein